MKPFVIFTLLLITILTARASSVIPLATPDLVQASDAVFRGTVVGMSCFKSADGLIYTRTSLRVDEPLKGKFPEVLMVVHRGGQVGNEDEYCGFSPRFRVGAEYLLFVERGADGKLLCVQGAASAIPMRRTNSGEFLPQDQALLDKVHQLTKNGEISGVDVTDQVGDGNFSQLVTTGMLGGVNARFLQPDRGDGIPYLIDVDNWPSGMSLAQATNAVLQALNAWTAVTSLRFKFEGFQSFGTNADAVTNNNERLRIQLHNNYHSPAFTGAEVLGIGGRLALTSVLTNTTWNIGGNVAGNEFLKTARGYVVLESTNSFMQDPVTFAEVLCHEIGHALNMAHSSEVATNDLVLSNSIMYFQAHVDGRGATLGSYDPPIIRQAYPSNTPPFAFDRFIDAVTSSSTPAVAGINEVRVGYDLQETNLAVTFTNETFLNGHFTAVGNLIKYAPSNYFGFFQRLNPGGNISNDRIFTRVSDGTNASPYFSVRVISFNPDGTTPSDGIPDSWMIKYFGHTAPMAGDKSQATNDADGDGLKNLQEYIAASNPTNAASAQRLLSLTNGTLQFQAKAYELYEVLASTNLTDWARTGVPFFPTNAPVEVLTNEFQTNITATVSNLPTDNPQMFFRILKSP